MANKIILEDIDGSLVLEDGSGNLVQEEASSPIVPAQHSENSYLNTLSLGEIVNKIKPYVSRSFTRASILNEVNSVLLLVASQSCLPDLLTFNTVTVLQPGDSIASLPQDFDHDLISVWSKTQKKPLTIRFNTNALYKYYTPGNIGPINEAAVEGKLLYVCPETSMTDELYIKYYRYPDQLVNDSDIPVCIPYHLRSFLLVDGVIARLKDDADKSKATYLERFSAGFSLLKQFYPSVPKSKPVLRRRVREF